MGRKTVGKFVTTTSQSVAAGSNVLFSSTTFSTNALGYDGQGGIQLKAPGVYMVYANFTTIATSATLPVQVILQANGVDVPGAKATDVAAAVGDVSNLAFATVVTVNQAAAGQYATLTVRNVNATTISTANVIVEKVA